jgi:O-antigen/teichoic acid export membrane protein
MVVILIFLGPYLFELVFGEGWYISGAFVRILAPMYGIRMIVSALTPALIISEKQRLELLIQSLFLISSIGSYVICKFRGFDINSFLILITITYSIIYIFFYAAIYRLSKQMQNKTREGEEK